MERQSSLLLSKVVQIHFEADAMPKLSGLIKQLKKERDRVERQLKGLDAALVAFATVYRLPKRARRVMSLAGRKKIAAAQRRRWAKVRKAAK